MKQIHNYYVHGLSYLILTKIYEENLSSPSFYRWREWNYQEWLSLTRVTGCNWQSHQGWNPESWSWALKLLLSAHGLCRDPRWVLIFWMTYFALSGQPGGVPFYIIWIFLWSFTKKHQNFDSIQVYEPWLGTVNQRFICSFHKYLLSTYQISGIKPDLSVPRKIRPSSQVAHTQWGR